MSKRPLTIVLISVHGLVRGNDLELGRDADTGGQVKYVVELARALGECSDVGKVVLLTRRVIDDQVSSDYAEPIEMLSDKASIVRVECGEARYLRKELLWDVLETFVDNAYDYLKTLSCTPDWIHGHYADAGYVGARLAHRLGIPLVFTGHSLGRNKRSQLLANGVKHREIEATYNISRRIEAEETTLSAAQRIITSTQQEIENQYGLYDFYQPDLMRVIPPGVDLTSFFPPSSDEPIAPISRELSRFLSDPHKPMILSIARPDPKKNFVSLLTAYGQSPALQAAANLVLVANRFPTQHLTKFSNRSNLKSGNCDCAISIPDWVPTSTRSIPCFIDCMEHARTSNNNSLAWWKRCRYVTSNAPSNFEDLTWNAKKTLTGFSVKNGSEWRCTATDLLVI